MLNDCKNTTYFDIKGAFYRKVFAKITVSVFMG